MLSYVILFLELFVLIFCNQNSHFVCYGTSIKFELCKYLISNRISYEKIENQDLQLVSYYVTLLLAYTSWILFFFSILSVFEAFLLSLLHCCWMDDDLEFCLVMVLIMLVAVRKKLLP